jgi:hypothetical protein
MTDLDWFKVLLFATPIAIFLVALAMIPLTRWQDEREARRTAERNLRAPR